MNEQYPHISTELGSTELTGYFLTGSNQFGHEVEDMVIYDRASWQVYVTRALPDVLSRLEKRGCQDGFSTICHLLEYEREGIVRKETIINMFSEVLGM